MKNHLILFTFATLLLSVNSGIAQTESSSFVTNSLFKINFYYPGVSYEQSIGKFSTLYLAPYLNGIITNKEENLDRKRNFYLTPCFNVGYRNYYNIKQRYEKGKNITLNSANYFSTTYILRYTKTTPDSDYSFLHQIGIGYGIQRNWSSGFALDIQGGMKYTFDADNINYYSPLKFYIHCAIGYWLGKKK